MAIQNFAGTFFHDSSSLILPAAVIGVPLVMQGVKIGMAIYEDPGCVKRNFLELKKKIVNAFTQQPDEDSAAFKRRLAKNIALTVLAVAILSAAAVCPFFILPASFAIPAALAGVHAVGLGIKYVYKSPDIFAKIKYYLVDSFKKRTGETDDEFKARRFEAIKRIVLCTLVFAAAVTAICFASHISLAMSKAASIWDITSILPNQTPLVVFAEYLAVGVLHSIQAVRYWKKGDKKRAIFHMTSALLCVAFPLGYFFDNSHGMRLHHSFTGLLLQLAPWDSVKAFGCFITFDSSLYFVNNKRGFKDNFGSFTQYDFMNSVVDRMSFVLTALTAMCLLEKITDYFFKTKKKKNRQTAFEQYEASKAYKHKCEMILKKYQVKKREKVSAISQQLNQFFLQKEARKNRVKKNSNFLNLTLKMNHRDTEAQRKIL